MEIRYFKDLWEQRKKPDLNTSEVFWDSRAVEFNESTDKDQERVNRIIRLFEGKGVLGKDKSVLDIGSGTGKFALRFAPLVQEVVGVDLSSRMLSFARDNAERKKIANVSFEKLNWGEADLDAQGWHNRFDLVFAANCPGINNLNALEKMINASRGYCFISAFVFRKDSLKDDLGVLLKRKPKDDRQGTGFYCTFNLLWHMGYYPEVQYADGSWEYVMTREKADRYYTTHFDMFQPLDQQEKDLLNRYLEQKTGEDGFIRDQVTAKFGWIYWKV